MQSAFKVTVRSTFMKHFWAEDASLKMFEDVRRCWIQWDSLIVTCSKCWIMLLTFKHHGKCPLTWLSPERHLQLSLAQFCLLGAFFPLTLSRGGWWPPWLSQSRQQWLWYSCSRWLHGVPSSLMLYCPGQKLLVKCVNSDCIIQKIVNSLQIKCPLENSMSAV